MGVLYLVMSTLPPQNFNFGQSPLRFLLIEKSAANV